MPTKIFQLGRRPMCGVVLVPLSELCRRMKKCAELRSSSHVTTTDDVVITHLK